MTSQLALMNKNAIALASDSAVTVGDKTYNSATKIFTLGGKQPIGFMISNAGIYLPCNVSWERVIGLFSDEIGVRILPTVADYVKEFKKFLLESPKLMPNSENSTYIQSDLIEFLQHWLNPETKSKLDDVAYSLGIKYEEFPGLDEYVSDNLNKRIDHLHNQIVELVQGLNSKDQYKHIRITEFHAETLNTANQIFCEMYDVSSERVNKTLEILSYHLANNSETPGGGGGAFSNLIIAGFGSEEISPVLVELKVGAIIDPQMGPTDEGTTNFIRIRTNLSDEGGLEFMDDNKEVSGAAFIIPYAQHSEIQNILNGIHNELINSYFMDKLPRFIADSVLDQLTVTLSEIDGIGPSTQAKIIKGFQESSDPLKQNIFKELGKAVNHFRGKRRGMFRDSTRMMSAGQLAGFAKKLVSMEAEITYYSKSKRTVGGEIVVATITKEHGFVLIK
jgi:hypothetical protein|tara:strand:- start:110 stop:1453 length:1344 start_codon:yes stop_codon:yes gene_type:complete